MVKKRYCDDDQESRFSVSIARTACFTSSASLHTTLEEGTFDTSCARCEEINLQSRRERRLKPHKDI